MSNRAEIHLHENQFETKNIEVDNALKNVETIKFGNISIIRAGFGRHITTQDMLSQWVKKDELTDNDRAKIGGYGFSGGYYYNDNFIPNSEYAIRGNVERIAKVATGLMQMRAWKEANLVLSSVTVHPNILPPIVELLRKSDLKIKNYVHYGLACDGGGGSMLDCLGQKESDGPTVFIATETLSGQPVPRSKIKMSTLFGNGIAGIAAILGNEIKLVDLKLLKAEVKRDEYGVIKVPQAYQITDFEKERIAPPLWYDIHPNAKESFLFGKNVVLNTMTTQLGDMTKFADMDEDRTGIEFKNLILKVAGGVLDRFEDLFPHEQIKFGLFHQPSKVIALNVAKRLAKLHPGLEIPWLMENTGFNNISSATFFIAMLEAVKNGLINPDSPILIGTFGIGVSAHAGVVKFNPF